MSTDLSLSRPTQAGAPGFEPRSARRFVGLDGARISYLAAGSLQAGVEETILLIHGAGMSARSWTSQLRGLAPGLRVVAIDLPGRGASDSSPDAEVESYADAASRLLGALATGPVFVAGHSLGGGVALALAARHPDLVKGLVLISSCAKLPQSNGAMEALLGSLPLPIRKVLFFSTARRVLFARGAPSRAVQLGLKDLRGCPPKTVRSDLAAAKAMDMEGAAQGLRVPALVLCGTGDMLTPVALSQRLTDLIPGSRLHLVEKAGHMLPLEAPERVNQEIQDFVESVVGRTMRRSAAAQRGTKLGIVRRLIARVLALRRRRPGEGAAKLPFVATRFAIRERAQTQAGGRAVAGER